MSGNNLSGTVTPLLGNLYNLAVLRLAENPQLTGPLPESFSRLLHLQLLDVRGTALRHNGEGNTSLPSFMRFDRCSAGCGHVQLAHEFCFVPACVAMVELL